MLDYRVITVESWDAPVEAGNNCWHRYVIANGFNAITGYRPGSRNEVIRYAETCVSRLNTKHKFAFDKFRRPE